MAACEDRRKKQVLVDIQTLKIKLDLKYHFYFSFTWILKKGLTPYREEILKMKMQSWGFQTKTVSLSLKKKKHVFYGF